MTFIGDIKNWGIKALGTINDGMNNSTKWLGNHSKKFLGDVKTISKKIEQGAELADTFDIPFSKLIGKVARGAGAVSDGLLDTYFQKDNNALKQTNVFR